MQPNSMCLLWLETELEFWGCIQRLLIIKLSVCSRNRGICSPFFGWSWLTVKDLYLWSDYGQGAVGRSWSIGPGILPDLWVTYAKCGLMNRCGLQFEFLTLYWQSFYGILSGERNDSCHGMLDEFVLFLRLLGFVFVNVKVCYAHLGGYGRYWRRGCCTPRIRWGQLMLKVWMSKIILFFVYLKICASEK